MKIKLFFVFVFVYFSIFNSYAFSDIENNIYKEYIEKLVQKNIIDDTKEKFEPRNYITRAEFIKMLSIISNLPLKDGDSCFDDIKKDDWHAKYICSAKDNGFISGYNDGTFRPKENITLIEAFIFGSRFFSLEIPQKNIEKWQENYRDFMAEKNIFQKHEYNFKSFINRGQTAKLLVLLSEIKENKQINFSQNSSGCQIKNSSISTHKNIKIAGKNRVYYIHTPKNYNPQKSYKLIFAFHGRTNNADMVRNYMGIGGGKKGSHDDYIVVYPSGLGKGPYSWAETENLEFFDSLLEEIKNNYCIDTKKIFVVGHSLGGYMSNRLACLRGDILRGVVTVAGSHFHKFCDGAVASAQFHLKNDHLVAYSNSQKQIEDLKKYNSCKNQENISIGGEKCTLYTGCDEGNEVVFCNSYKTWGSDPHGWPMNGGKMIFDFFERQK